jgi:dephospho-CoA kinase
MTHRRSDRTRVIVLGLTGSIAMGKSTAAAMFRRLRVPVYDADRAVHRLMERGGLTVPMIDAAFPGVIRDGAVDRRALGARVFGDAAALATLEGILHPLVARQRQAFLRRASSERQPLVVLDVPLLFETGGERLCDAVAVVSAPAWLQYARLRRREGMSEERIAAILRRQMPDAEKRRRADFVIPTGRGKGATYAAIRQLVSTLLRRRATRPSRRQSVRRMTRASIMAPVFARKITARR